MIMAYVGVTLYQPIYPTNIGSVARLCTNYNISFLNLINAKFIPNATNVFQTQNHIPIRESLDELSIFENIPVNLRNVAVELCPEAKPIEKFIFPRCANLIFGPENGSLPQSIMTRCDHVIKMPTHDCLNLAHAVHACLLYRQFQKNTFKQQSLQLEALNKT